MALGKKRSSKARHTKVKRMTKRRLRHSKSKHIKAKHIKARRSRKTKVRHSKKYRGGDGAVLTMPGQTPTGITTQQIIQNMAAQRAAQAAASKQIGGSNGSNGDTGPPPGKLGPIPQYQRLPGDATGATNRMIVNAAENNAIMNANATNDSQVQKS